MPLNKKDKKYTYEEFLKIDSSSKENLEFIDGFIINQASPSTSHQTVVSNLSTEFGIYFKNKKCRHFVAPYDIILKNDNENNRVQPDLVIICDDKGYTQNNYEGIPSLIVEVLSPSTASNDYISKMGLYMRYGIKEYWIISPINKEIQIFNLNTDGYYSEPNNYKNNDTIKSNLFTDMKIKTNEIFEL